MARGWTWGAWGIATIAATGLLGGLMMLPDELSQAPIDRTVFLPGATTDGHYQIELDCDACHTQRFSDETTIQSACVDCHGTELAAVDDSHPRTKFTDPRNADRVAVLDARWCVTCHQEHRPEITSQMGLSLQEDYCYRCHENIGEERPTHADLPFDSCANVGCHNFHDNRSLYEDFLVEHRDEPDIVPLASLRARDLASLPEDRRPTFASPLTPDQNDAPANLPDLERWVEEWSATSHASAGVNCTSCHADDAGAWADVPSHTRCATCHGFEQEGYLAGRHGMRLAAGLSPMTPGEARLPMHADASDRRLDCNQCHPAHDYDTRHAAADACLECHADEHTKSWEASPHALLWREEVAGLGPPGSGVSCATCHLPRIPDARAPLATRVAHNQNDHLSPRDKMIRSSCLECHGLAFSIDSLADPALVDTNYRGRSTRKVESIHFAAVLRWELEGRTPPWAENEEEEGDQ